MRLFPLRHLDFWVTMNSEIGVMNYSMREVQINDVLFINGGDHLVNENKVCIQILYFTFTIYLQGCGSLALTQTFQD